MCISFFCRTFSFVKVLCSRIRFSMELQRCQFLLLTYCLIGKWISRNYSSNILNRGKSFSACYLLRMHTSCESFHTNWTTVISYPFIFTFWNHNLYISSFQVSSIFLGFLLTTAFNSEGHLQDYIFTQKFVSSGSVVPFKCVLGRISEVKQYILPRILLTIQKIIRG